MHKLPGKNDKSYLLSIISIGATLFLFELAARLLTASSESGPHQTPANYPMIYDQSLGYSCIPDSNSQGIKLNQAGQECYNVTYHCDRNGERFIPPRSDNSNQLTSLHLFGDSLVFGEGLKDEETLPYLLSDKAKVYNHALFGYGPQQSLRWLETYDGDQTVSENIGMYLLIPEHMERMVNSFRAFWLQKGPCYEFDENEKLSYRGSFSDSHPLLAEFYRIWLKLAEVSALARRMDISLLAFSENERLQITCAAMKQMQELFSAKFKGRLWIVLHPKWSDPAWANSYAEIKECLVTQSHILDLGAYNFSKKDMIGEGCDGHQNALFNAWLKDKFQLAAF